MASATVTLSNRFKADIVRKRIDLSADSIKGLLMRSGFVFNPDTHRTKLNVKAMVSVPCNFDTSTITVSTGGLLSAGFVSGMLITGSGTTSYNFSFICISVTDTILGFAGASWAAGASACLLTCQDEVREGNGYSRDAMLMSGININEDLESDLVSIVWGNYSVTATGGSIGPTGGVLIVGETWSTIIGYVSLASAEMIAQDNALVIAGVTIRVV